MDTVLTTLYFAVNDNNELICPTNALDCPYYKKGVCTCEEPYYNCDDFYYYYGESEEEENA